MIFSDSGTEIEDSAVRKFRSRHHKKNKIVFVVVHAMSKTKSSFMNYKLVCSTKHDN